MTKHWIFALAAAAAVCGSADAEERPEFSLPIACEPHKTCFIQSYFDVDTGPGVTDFACGGATYDTHDGVDFRLLSASAAKAGVAVLAAADGTVKGVRDGVADIFVSKGPPGAVKGRECGNGVVIDHGGGWETQYCHMKQGSVVAKSGQAVKRGDRLGDVGFSGLADFAHVHFLVRRSGKKLDPFMPEGEVTACQRETKGAGLWKAGVAALFPYQNGEIIVAGFAGAAVDHNALEADHQAVTQPEPKAQSLIIYGRFINLLKGDRIRMSIAGPGGALFDQTSEPVDRNKATYTSFGGRKLKTDRWPAGRYEGKLELLRDGAAVRSKTAEFAMP